MDEFGIDLDNSENVGTSVLKLNETNNKKDYIENFKNNLETEKLSTRPKKHINMDKIIKNIEMDINNFDDYNDIKSPKSPKKTIIIEDSKSESKDYIIYMLIFMLLNNKLIIEYIYKILVFVPVLNSPVPNLVLRTVLFGVIIFVIKKYNLV